MSNFTLNILLKEYEKKKFTAELNFEKAKTDFYNSHPDLANLNDKLNTIALDISKAILNNNLELIDKLKKDFESLKLEKEKMLKTITIPINVFAKILDMRIREIQKLFFVIASSKKCLILISISQTLETLKKKILKTLT